MSSMLQIIDWLAAVKVGPGSVIAMRTDRDDTYFVVWNVGVPGRNGPAQQLGVFNRSGNLLRWRCTGDHEFAVIANPPCVEGASSL